MKRSNIGDTHAYQRPQTWVELVQACAVVVAQARPLARELVGRGRHPLTLDACERRVGAGAVRDVTRVKARDIARAEVIGGNTQGASRKRNIVRRIEGRRRPAGH
jgi:hypothetical protein